MTEAIQELFKNMFGDNVVLATIIISMLPIIELRGGIPFGMSKTFWGSNALTSWKSMWWAFLGSSLVVPILALVLIPILNWLKRTKLFRKLATKFENSIKAKSQKIESKSEEDLPTQDDQQSTTMQPVNQIVYNKKFFAKLFGVMLFVAIPLPLTGVWTGTAIAVMLNIPFWWTCLAVILGNLIAGIIMQTICAIFPNFTTWILLIFLCLTALLLLIAFIKNKIKSKKLQSETSMKNTK